MSQLADIFDSSTFAFLCVRGGNKIENLDKVTTEKSSFRTTVKFFLSRAKQVLLQLEYGTSNA